MLEAMSLFYPSLVVNLQLRFDESLSLIPSALVPTSVKDKEAGGLSTLASAARIPLLLKGQRDPLTQVIGLIPRTCTVELPAYRQAGKFEASFVFQDLPLDPRVVRAIGVAVHLGAVPAGDFSRGVTQPSRIMFAGGQGARFARRSVITPTPDNLVLAGVADSIDVEHTSEGSVVRIEGRDLRAIFLDTPVRAGILSQLRTDEPIHVLVARIIMLHPLAPGVTVEVDDADWPQGVPRVLDLTTLTRANLDAAGKAPVASSKGASDSLNYWDLITQFCFLVGAVPYFVGSQLWVRPAKSLFDFTRQDRRAARTPFAGGAARTVGPAGQQEQITYRRMVFGRDLEVLKFERKLAGKKSPVIECVSYDTASKARGGARLITVQHPPEAMVAARTTKVAPSGDGAETEILRIPVPGVRSVERLRLIAQNLYEEIGRSEMGGSASTKNLSSLGGGNGDADLLRLRPGDPVEFRVDASGLRVLPPPVSELTNHEARSFAEEVAEVTKRVGDENLARVLVATSRGAVAQVQSTFRVANVHFGWDANSGVAVDFDFQNYVEARSQV